LRILELITLGETGGAQTVLVDLIKGFVDGNYDVEIDVVCGPGEYVPKALPPRRRGRVIQVPWLRRNIEPFYDVKALLEIYRLCKNNNYDIVHCHSSKASWLGRIAASWAGMARICMTVHGLSFYAPDSTLLEQVYKKFEGMVPLAADYVFVSPKDAEEMQLLGLSANKCVLIPNGRPAPPYPAVGIREILKIPHDSPMVCMIARLAKIKNPLLFIKIAEAVLQKWPANKHAPHFVLIGDGPMLAECREAVIRGNMQGLVHVPGQMDNAGQYFWDADAALLTSDYEACPLAVIEAMAVGTPVVATNVGGTGSVLEHGKTGYLFEQGEAKEAANYLLSLLQNKQQCDEMGKNAVKRYNQYFTVESMVDQYARHFGLQKI
jgi:glycosyltransferase involved in cell wall biosynthesis